MNDNTTYILGWFMFVSLIILTANNNEGIDLIDATINYINCK